MKNSKTHLLLNLFEQKNISPAQPKAAEPEAERKEKFEQLIKGEYKDLYSRKIKDIISKRLKGTEELKEKLAQMQDIIDILSEKYGVDANDISELRTKVMEDDSLISEQADKKGVDVKEAYEKNIGTYGRFADAVKYIDPREE